MKVGEQAVFFARLKGLSRHEAVMRLKKWFVKFGIESWWDRKVDELSKGMAQKVQFIVTVLHEPELLIFDEPFRVSIRSTPTFEGGDSRLARQGFDGHLFDPQHVVRRGDLRPYHAYQQVAQHSYGPCGRDPAQARQQHFQVAYRGDAEALRGVLEGRCEVLEQPEPEFGAAYSSLKLHVERDADVREVIARINDAVELRSFTEIIPSMNDIFIRAVGGTLNAE